MNQVDERYTDWKEIGKGGIGTVYKVYDNVLKRFVAIKFLQERHLSNPVFMDTLHQEVSISRDLRHPNICPIHDVYQSNRGTGIVMDLIDGGELRDWLTQNQGRLLETSRDRLVLFRKIAETLAFAHTHIVHRDLKPENIFLIKNDPARPVIMDFGTCVVDETTPDGALIAGTLKYMSPEQWNPPHRVDQRADLFALGIMAYEMFTNRIPPTSLKGARRSGAPHIPLDAIDPPSAFNAAVPPALDRVILQLMAYRPEDRPQSAQEVLEALAGVTLRDPSEVLVGGGKDMMAAMQQRTISLAGGLFYLGSGPGQGNPDEKPARKVELSPFRMSVYPVTNAEYDAFLRATGYHALPEMDNPVFRRPDHPVVGVTFEDAMAYCQWLGGTLPTEAQWEYAAKGGAKFPVYPWGDDEPTVTKANINEVSSTTSPVGSCPAGVNPFGLHDLCGNVWEWCLDWYDRQFYRQLSQGVLDPINSRETGEKVLRGGGFDSFSNQGRCAFRFHLPPDEMGLSVGFRVVFPES